MGLISGFLEGWRQGSFGQRCVGVNCTNTVIVVGTEYRKPVVSTVAKRMGRNEEFASLVPEPSNAHDRNALRVVILGETVGYLSSCQAGKYKAAVALAKKHREFITPRAVVRRAPGKKRRRFICIFLESRRC